MNSFSQDSLLNSVNNFASMIDHIDIESGLQKFVANKFVPFYGKKLTQIRSQYQAIIIIIYQKGYTPESKKQLQGIMASLFNTNTNTTHRAIVIGVLTAMDGLENNTLSKQDVFNNIFKPQEKILSTLIKFGANTDTSNTDKKTLQNILGYLFSQKATGKHADLLFNAFKLYPEQSNVDDEQKSLGQKANTPNDTLAFITQANILLGKATAIMEVWSTMGHTQEPLNELITIFDRIQQGRDINAVSIAAVASHVSLLLKELLQKNIHGNADTDELIKKSISIIELLLPALSQGKGQIEIFDATLLVQRISAVTQRALQNTNTRPPIANFIIDAESHISCIHSYLDGLLTGREKKPSEIFKLSFSSFRVLTEVSGYLELYELAVMFERLIQYAIDMDASISSKDLKLIKQWVHIITSAIQQIKLNKTYSVDGIDNLVRQLEQSLTQKGIETPIFSERSYRKEIQQLRDVLKNNLVVLPEYKRIFSDWSNNQINVKELAKLRFELLYIEQYTQHETLHDLHDLVLGILAYGEKIPQKNAILQGQFNTMVHSFSQLFTIIDAIKKEEKPPLISKDIIQELFVPIAANDDNEISQTIEQPTTGISITKIDSDHDTHINSTVNPSDTTRNTDKHGSDQPNTNTGDLSALDTELLNIFFTDAEHACQQIEVQITEWKSRPQIYRYADSVMRLLHQIKNGARLAQLNKIANLVLNLENFILEYISQKNIDINFFNKIQCAYEIIKDEINYHRQTNQNTQESAKRPYNIGDTEHAIGVIDTNTVNTFTEPEATFTEIDTLLPDNEIVDTPILPATTSDIISPSDTRTDPDTPPVTDSDSDFSTENCSNDETEVVQVSSGKFEQILDNINDINMSRWQIAQQVNVLSDSANDLNSTSLKIQQLFSSLKSISIKKKEETPELEHLLHQCSEITSDIDMINFMIDQRVNNVNTLLKENAGIHSNLNLSLMQNHNVSFSKLKLHCEDMIERLNVEAEKNATIVWGNHDHEIDKQLMKKLIFPLEAVLENIVHYSLEKREQRLRIGKSAMSCINIDYLNDGLNLYIKIVDDGQGIDFQFIRDQIITQGVVPSEQIPKVTEQTSLIELMIEHNLPSSMVDTVDEVPLREAVSQVKELGGELNVESQPKFSTSYLIKLPQPMALMKLLTIKHIEQTFLLPIRWIESIEMIDQTTLKQARDTGYLTIAHHSYQYYYFGHLIAAPISHIDSIGQQNIILFNVDNKRYALHVDEVLGIEEVVLRSFPPIFDNVAGLIGLSLLQNGVIATLMDINILFTNALSDHQVTIDVANEIEESMKTSLLVVDDSISIRQQIKTFLQGKGYEVLIAKNGMDALKVLYQKQPSILILDSSIPEMNVSELMMILNNDPIYRDIPCILMSAYPPEEKLMDRVSHLSNIKEIIKKPLQLEEMNNKIQKILSSTNDSPTTHIDTPPETSPITDPIKKGSTTDNDDVCY